MNNALVILADIPAPTPAELSISVGLIIFIGVVVLGIITLTIYGVYRFFHRPDKKIIKKNGKKIKK